MISFNKFGEYGRFGNQLFQYAFLRTQAKKIGTNFYCPDWLGDRIFCLNDESEKGSCVEQKLFYNEGDKNHGYQIEATKIENNTDIVGYFQSSRFFSRAHVLKWYTFNEDLFLATRTKYCHIDFSNSTSIHIRLGDYAKAPLLFYISKPSYFKQALLILGRRKHILVFSDSPKLAKKYLSFLPQDTIFVEGNKDYEDFYLMSHCRDMICSTSTFCWWAAYINNSEDKKVIVPKRLFLPGAPTFNKDLFEVEGWVQLSAHRFYDNYYIKYIPVQIIKQYNKFIKLVSGKLKIILNH